MWKQIRSLARSFRFAGKGFWWMLTRERNFRIHLTCLAYMLFFLLRYDFFVLSRTDLALLLLAASAVIANEMINTGIEKADDTVTLEQRTTIAISKDVAAGGVLVSAIAAVGVGICVLWQPKAFAALYHYYAGHLISLALLLLSFVPALWFIFRFGRKTAAADTKPAPEESPEKQEKETK